MNEQVKVELFALLKVLKMLLILGIIFWVAVLPVIHWTLTGQHPILESLRQYLAHNLADIISAIGSHIAALFSVLGLLFTGMVSTRPKTWPKTKQDWYEWLGAAFEVILPVRFRNNGNHDPAPVEPPKEKV